MECEACGETDSIPHTCSRCGQSFCVSHRLPESHDCAGLEAERKIRQIKREAGESGPWFKDEFHLSNVGEDQSRTTDDAGSSSGRWESYGRPEKSQKSETLKQAAKRAEEKRTPDYEQTPDVAPDGSLVHAGDGEDETEADGSADGRPISPRRIQLLVVLAFVCLLVFTVYRFT